MTLGRLSRSFLSLILVVLLGGFAAAALVRYSPGFDVDENTWNPRISAPTADAMRAARQRENRLLIFYPRYLLAAAHGDFGESEHFRAPVAELLRERAPVSLQLLGMGWAGGLLAGGVLGWLAVWPRREPFAWFGSSLSGLLIAIPPAVLAIAFFFTRAPLSLAVALTVLPRVFGTVRALLADVYASSELLAARARGVAASTLAFRYVWGNAASQWIALAGVALVIAFGSLIPIETLCDVPGIGQLALTAALARDLPLLSALALLITFVVASLQTLGDIATPRGEA